MSEPFYIIAAPFEAWVAPVGTAFPAIDAAPGPEWVKLGTSGSLDYTEDGVTVTHEQTTEVFRGLGETGPRKVFRTEESLRISFTVADVSLETYAHALNGNAVDETPAAAGTAGFKTLGLSRGTDVLQRALLLRGPSPYGDGWSMQYEVPLAFQTGSPEVVYQKGTPAGLALEWTAIVDPAAATPAERFGRLRAQHEAAL